MTAVATVERDTELMQRVRDGDSDSFALLLDRHRGTVVHFLYRMIQNQALAEELAQEVFLRVYRARDSYEPTAKFTTWLFRIASRQALNSLRDRRKERGDELPAEVIDRTPTTEQLLVKEERMLEIRSAIQALPEKQRAAVLMHKYHEMDYTQIAGALETTETAVKSLLFRAYQTLRGRLAHLNTNGERRAV